MIIGVFWFCFFSVIMNMKFIFWNCQGTGHPRFHKFVVEYRREFNLDIFCFFETRVSGDRVDGIISKLGFDNSHRNEVVCFVGGIWVLWNDTVHVDIVDFHPQVITMKIRDSIRQSEFFCSAVYASPHGLTRRALWDHLGLIAFRVEGPWIIASDFN